MLGAEKPAPLLHRAQPAFYALDNSFLWVVVRLSHAALRSPANLLEIVLDIPIVLPFGIGISLWFSSILPLFLDKPMGGLEIPAVILAQFMVACAFARGLGENILDKFRNATKGRLTSTGQAFRLVVMPQAKQNPAPHLGLGSRPENSSDPRVQRFHGAHGSSPTSVYLKFKGNPGALAYPSS